MKVVSSGLRSEAGLRMGDRQGNCGEVHPGIGAGRSAGADRGVARRPAGNMVNVRPTVHWCLCRIVRSLR